MRPFRERELLSFLRSQVPHRSLGKAAQPTSSTSRRRTTSRRIRDFSSKNGFLPNDYAAHAYDSIMLIDSAVKGVKGDMSKKDDGERSDGLDRHLRGAHAKQ